MISKENVTFHYELREVLVLMWIDTQVMHWFIFYLIYIYSKIQVCKNIVTYSATLQQYTLLHREITLVVP